MSSLPAGDNVVNLYLPDTFITSGSFTTQSYTSAKSEDSTEIANKVYNELMSRVGRLPDSWEDADFEMTMSPTK